MKYGENKKGEQLPERKFPQHKGHETYDEILE